MGLIRCVDCEKMISEHAEICPYCGCPMSIILEKAKIEPDNTVIEKKITIESVNDLVKYRSLCKVPKEITERTTFLSEEEQMQKPYDGAMEMMNSAKTEKEANAKKRRKNIIACACVVVGLAIFAKSVISPDMNDNNANENLYGQHEDDIGQNEDDSEIKEDNLQNNKFELLKSADVGDIVYFGTYEQDNIETNGKEEIEWQVLAEKDNRILLLSKYALDCKPYHQTSEDITWEECTLRSWLNEEFLDVAFSDEEEKLIPTVTVSAEKNPEYDTNPGNVTEDKIFLLSITEACLYTAACGVPMECKPTEYANGRGVYKNSDNGCVWWWLRTPGRYQDYAAGVLSNEEIGESGKDVHYGIYAVRPALWVERTP